MRTIGEAYIEIEKAVDAVDRQVRGTLADFCTKRSFIMISRIKSIESIQDKIDTGRYQKFSKIDDIIAYSVIVDTLSQKKEVMSFLRKAFRVVLIRHERTLTDERVFDFDCMRVYCSLSQTPPQDSKISSIVFEIQIRTILQHAWSKITHPLVYKGQRFDPKASRLASEIMAHIERLDRTFSRFRTESKNVKVVNRHDMLGSNQIVDMIDKLISQNVIPPELRPVNGRRLGENIFSSIKDRRKNLDTAISHIEKFFRDESIKFPRSVSLFQMSLVALHRSNMLDITNKKRYYYITRDLISLYPDISSITHTVDI